MGLILATSTAPAIVRASSLMPIKVIEEPRILLPNRGDGWVLRTLSTLPTFGGYDDWISMYGGSHADASGNYVLSMRPEDMLVDRNWWNVT